MLNYNRENAFENRKQKSHSEVVMGPCQIFLTRIGLGQFFVARVRSDQPFMVWVWKISPKNFKFSIFLPSDQK